MQSLPGTIAYKIFITGDEKFKKRSNLAPEPILYAASGFEPWQSLNDVPFLNSETIDSV